MTRRLHVANGTSTTASIDAAGIPGSTSIWADPLHDGPVPGGLADEALLAVRAQHLAGQDRPLEAVTAELLRWRGAIDDHAAYDELVLWYEHDLFDQLNLIQVLDRLGPAWPAPVTLVCIGSYPGRPHFKGLGELAPAELRPLFEARQPVTAAQYALATQAWHAFRAATPLDLEAVLRTDTTALPFLAAALSRHLEELPWTSDGLSRTERQLLSLAVDGPLDLRGAFARIHDGETAFYVADDSFLTLALALAASSPPLLLIEDGAIVQGLRGVVTLTEAGRAVLERRDDRVRQCGLERWLGGVELSGTGPMWRWDAPARRVVLA